MIMWAGYFKNHNRPSHPIETFVSSKLSWKVLKNIQSITARHPFLLFTGQARQKIKTPIST